MIKKIEIIKNNRKKKIFDKILRNNKEKIYLKI